MNVKTLLVFAVVLFPAFQANSQMRSGDNIVIREKVDRDLYIAGGNVTINAPINGDLITAGGTIIINDSITQDLIIAGGNVMVNGYIGDDVRCAGGSIAISGDIKGDLVVAGGQIIVDEGVVINGDLLVTGGEVTVDGIIHGYIRSASGTFTLNGKAGKGISGRGGEIAVNGTVNGPATLAAKKISLGADALFNDNVTYWNKSGSLNFANSLQDGEAVYDPSLRIETGRWLYLGFASVLMVLWYLGTALLMIFLIEYLFSTTFKKAASTARETSLRSLGLGFLFLVGIPILIIVSFFTVIGIPVGILLMTGYIIGILFATVIVSVLISNWINNVYYGSSWGFARLSFTAFGIFIILKLASLTPFVGPLIMLLLISMAFGSILQNVKWRRKTPLSPA